MKARTALALLGLLALIVAACGGTPAATSPSPSVSASASPSPVPAGQLDADTIAKAKTEGQLVLYTSLSSDDSKFIADRFMASTAGAGIKVTVNRKSSEPLVTQFMTEVKAGRVLADVLESGGIDISQPMKEGYIEAFKAPAAAAFPADLKDANGMWTAARLGVETIAWNTGPVNEASAPKSFDDLADPKWAGKCLIESSDVEVFLGLAVRKYKDDAKAQDVLTKTMANCKPFAGHTETLDLLIAGQGQVFWGAHAHSTEQKRAAGAPVDYMRSEGVVTIDGPGLVKGAPHPNAAKVFINWYVGEEGQKALAERSRVPARPGVANPRLLPATIYYTGPTLAEQFKKYQDMWNKIVLKK